MIRIRTGEHWKLNPDYLRSLQGYLPRRPRSFTAAGVLDVLGIEIDGAPFGGHLGEEPIFRLVPDLVEAVGAVSRGETGARQVSLPEAGIELVIARKGQTHASLSMVSLRRPARVLVPEVEVELDALAEAVRDCATQLVADLGAINPALQRSPLVRTLSRELKRLKVSSRLPVAPSLEVGRAPAPDEDGVAPHAAHLAVGFDLLDDEGRIESAGGKGPDLYSLLVPGRVFLRDDQGAELASASGLLFLLFTELVRVVADLVRATEAGDAEFAFSLSSESRPMPLDLKAQMLLVDGRPVRCASLALARTALEAVLDFAGTVRGRNARHASNGYLTDLTERAKAELHVVSELESGDLVSAAAALPRAARAPAEPPLGDGRLRRLSYRIAWRAAVPGPLWGMELAGSTLWCGSGQSCLGLDVATGRERWRARGDRVCTVIDDRHALVLAPAAHLELCDLATGEVAWFRSRPTFSVMGSKAIRIGAGPRPMGLCAVVDGRRIWAADGLTGRTIWEFAPPLAGHVWLSGGGPLLIVAGDGGFAYALDPATGTPVWRTRTGKPLEGEPTLAGKLALFTATVGREIWLIALEAATGRPVFSRNLEIEACGAVLPSARRIIAIGSGEREAVAVALSRSGALLRRTTLSLGRGVPAAIRAAGAIFASGRDGSACRLDDAGNVVWTVSPGGEDLGRALAPLYRRGVAVAAGARVGLLEPATGKLLDRLEAMPGLVAMKNDRSLGLFLGDEEGAVVAYRLATHLSVVG
jgi:hypothetical protein